MNTFPFIAIGILALLITVFVLAIPAFRRQQEEFRKTGKHPKGHYLGIGIALGLPLGLPIGLALDNIGIGPALGLPIGLAIGAALEKKHAAELRPLTAEEQKIQSWGVIMGLVLLVLGVLAGLVFFYLSR